MNEEGILYKGRVIQNKLNTSILFLRCFYFYATLTRSMSFHIRTKTFQGPIQLLFSLIEKRELPINDISLAEISGDFIRFVQEHEHEIPLSEIAQFISLISTLVLIKAKALLPSLELEEEEEGDIEELKRRLTLYKLFKERAKELKLHVRERRPFLAPRQRIQKERIRFLPPEGLNVKLLKERLESLTGEAEQFSPTRKTAKGRIRIHVHIRDITHKLMKRITGNGKALSFSRFVQSLLPVGREGGTHYKEAQHVYTLVSFLASLELNKNGKIDMEQEEIFSEIFLQGRRDDSHYRE